MFNIAQYLDKFKNIGQGEKAFKEVVFFAIKEILNIEIERKNISIQNGELILKVSPTLKNAVFIKKEKILNKIKEKTTQKVLEIR